MAGARPRPEYSDTASATATPTAAEEDNPARIDPETQPWDLGDDPVEFAAKRLAIARDLFAGDQMALVVEAGTVGRVAGRVHNSELDGANA